MQAATRVKHYVADRFIHLSATRNWKRSARPLTASKQDRSSFIPARHSGEGVGKSRLYVVNQYHICGRLIPHA